MLAKRGDLSRLASVLRLRNMMPGLSYLALLAVTSELSDLRKLHAMQKAINDAKEEQVRLARERRLSESLASGWKRLRSAMATRRCCAGSASPPNRARPRRWSVPRAPAPAGPPCVSAPCSLSTLRRHLVCRPRSRVCRLCPTTQRRCLVHRSRPRVFPHDVERTVGPAHP